MEGRLRLYSLKSVFTESDDRLGLRELRRMKSAEGMVVLDLSRLGVARRWRQVWM